MCVLMGVRDARALARACDLGVAMQLTNIARDVGEDARAGRLYLPTDWLEEAGIVPDAFLADPRPTPAIRRLVGRLLREAGTLYARSEAGIALLPAAARPGIFAARYVYAGIGSAVAAADCDSITGRARTGGAAKAAWLAMATIRAGATLVMPRSPLLYAQPLPETAFLVDAAAETGAAGDAGRAERLVSLFATLERKDRASRDGLPHGARWAS